MPGTIYTRADGTPIERPEPPAAGADIEEQIAYTRRVNDFRDEVNDVANAAFAEGFTAALQR